MSVKEMIDLPALVRARGLELPPPTGQRGHLCPLCPIGQYVADVWADSLL